MGACSMTADGHDRSGKWIGAKGRYLWMGMLVMIGTPLLRRARSRRAGKGDRLTGAEPSGSTTADKSIGQQQTRRGRRDRTALDGDFPEHDAELTRKEDNGRPADARQSAGAVSRRPLIRVVCMAGL